MASESYSVAITGDALLNTPVSRCHDPGFLRAIELLRGADATISQLEIPLVDTFSDDCFPAAEAAMSWMSSPSSIVDELRWCGVDMVTAASNHALDFSQGGVRSTVTALESAFMPCAGIGRSLSEARQPAVFSTALARISVISATSSFARGARAADPSNGIPGRPGVNPLAFVDVVDTKTAAQIISLTTKLGRWVTTTPHEIVVNRPGLFNTTQRFIVDDSLDRPTTRCDPDDLAQYIQAVSRAAQNSDFVTAHLHSHEWDASDNRMTSQSAFVDEFAASCAAAGAALVVVQGAHAPFRGASFAGGIPVIHDPGPLFRRGLRQPQPHEFYDRWHESFGPDPLSDAERSSREFIAGSGTFTRISPREGISHSPGFVVPVCSVDAATHRVQSVKFHPMQWITTPKSQLGFPAAADGRTAQQILELFSLLTEPPEAFGHDGITGRLDCL